MAALAALMAVVFAQPRSSLTLLYAFSTAGQQRIRLGPIEQYAEVISGAFIALALVVFWIMVGHL
jgi:hypothetical protein